MSRRHVRLLDSQNVVSKIIDTTRCSDIVTRVSFADVGNFEIYEKYDNALARAFSAEDTPFGIQERGLLIATARRAAADNRIKALNEAALGQFHFAKVHESASLRYHEDAEALAKSGLPTHQTVAHYFSIAEAYRTDDRERASANQNWRRDVA